MNLLRASPQICCNDNTIPAFITVQMEIVQILFSVAIDTLAAAYLESMIPISDVEQTGRQ